MKKIPDQNNCALCRLSKTRLNVVISDGKIKENNIVVIGEAPGADEDLLGKPFVGRSGQLLRKYTERFGSFALGKEATVLNIVSCRPPNNRAPVKDEIEACNTWLRLNISIIKPNLVLLIGKTAAKSFLREKYVNARGKFLTSKCQLETWKYNDFICFHIWHPSYMLRNFGKPEIFTEWTKHIRIFGKMGASL